MAEPNISSTRSASKTPTSTGNPSHTRSADDANPGGSRPNRARQSSGIVDRVKESATAQLTTQKDRGIDALGSFTQAVRSSTQKLRDESHDTIASYVDKAADQIETWSRQLREKDAEALLTDVQRLARRQPAAFIGSAFVLGLVGARFLKSSRQRDEYDDRSEARRARYGGTSSRMSTGQDRRQRASGESDVEMGSSEVAIPDVSSSGAPPASPNRKTGSRTEK